MLGDLGFLLTALALAATLYGGIAALVSILSEDRRWLESGQNALRASAALLGGALFVLVLAFLTNDFRITYVAQHSARLQPLYLKISAVWGGQEGSLLLWSALQAFFTLVALREGGEHKRLLIPWATVVLAVVGAFFTGVTLLLSNPFVQMAQMPVDGRGLNPVLRHPGMLLHPPTLYVGYVGLSVPFAFALASLAVKLRGSKRSAASAADTGPGFDRPPAGSWVRTVHGWLLLAWLGLGLGLLLGMRWAYDVLGWGGYWGWDPVENAGLMPWFTLTALLHGAVVEDEAGRRGGRRGFRMWNYILAVLSFVLVLFGTFATRSGVIQSVHAYAVSNLGGVFMAAIAVALIVGIGLVIAAFRRESRDAGEPSRSPAGEDFPLFSREGLFFLTLVLFLMLTFSVFVGSVLPTLTQVLVGQRFEAGPDWFDRVTGPQFALLVLLLGVCPLIGRGIVALRRNSQPAAVGYGVWIGALGAGATAGLGLLAGFGQAASLLGFALVGLAATTVFLEFGHAAARRMRQRGEMLPVALWKLVRTQRRRYGGNLVHLGVILMAVGVIGTRMYQVEQEMVFVSGQPAEVGRYTLVFDMLNQQRVADRQNTWAEVSLYTDRGYQATLLPQIGRYSGYQQSYADTALRAGVREDLMLILAGWSEDGTAVTMRAVVNPLAFFLWLGGLVFLAGGALAFWPRSAGGSWNIIAPVLLVALLAGSAWAMWGTAHGVVRQRGVAEAASSGARYGGRPRAGQAAPELNLPTLTGETVSLEALRGGVVVLNFWAPWCPSCKEDMPMLQAVSEEYLDRGVTFVGVAFQAEEAAIVESLTAAGVSYAVGVDQVGDTVVRYGITGVPETFILDADGIVSFVNVGPLRESALRRELDALVEER
jgi:cytochrome c-type biogenesis protein CcmF